MSLETSLSIAGSGLANIQAQLALVSHNVANASTPGYVRETMATNALDAAGLPMGVRDAPAARAVDDTALQAAVLKQNATVAGFQTTSTALSALDGVMGAPGSGTDLASLLGKLQDDFSTLLGDPSSAAQQSQVVAAAGQLTQSLNDQSNAITAQRQAAQDGIVSSVAGINSALQAIGDLSLKIMAGKEAGQSTADLESQRDAQVANLGQLVNITVLPQANGDMLITTASGLQLPTSGAMLTTSPANVQPGAYYPGGGIQPIMLGGVDATGSLTGGQVGAQILLRDTTLPGYQGQLDEFAETLAGRFAAQGLALFTDPAGNVPTGIGPLAQSGYVGVAAQIQVNPSVQASPALVRDGTTAIAGSAAGASAFTPNPAGGPAGFATLISRVLNFALGTDAQSGVAQPAPATTGLGPIGTLAARYAPPATLAGFATAVTASMAADSGAASAQLDTEQQVQTTLQTRLSSETGVSIDTEMSHMIALQNAYGANAKVMAAVQSMFAQILNTVAA